MPCGVQQVQNLLYSLLCLGTKEVLMLHSELKEVCWWNAGGIFSSSEDVSFFLLSIPTDLMRSTHITKCNFLYPVSTNINANLI